MSGKKIRIRKSELRRIIRETLEEEARQDELLVREMAATPEPFHRDELATAANDGYEELKKVAIEWISNIWGLGQASGDKQYMDYAQQANQTLGALLKKTPVFARPR